MANATYERIYVLDTAGTIVTEKPIWIRKIVLIPNAAGDSCTLNYWDTNAPYAAGSGTYSADLIAGTITSTTTLTMASGTLLPSTCRDGDVFKIIKSDGAAANISTNVITTAGNNTVVVCANAGWTNEATKYYGFITYPYKPAFHLLSQATNAREEERDFGGCGFFVPNLTLETISSGAKVWIYLR